MPRFQCNAMRLHTAYAASDTDSSGTAWAGDKVCEIPRESLLYICILVD